MFGDRLRLARKRLGLSLRGLAARLKGAVSAQSLGKYERGEMKPGSDTLVALSQALELPISYFMSPLQVELAGLEFRKKAGTTVKDRARVEAEVVDQVERYLTIEQVLGLESADWNNPLSSKKRITALEQAEELADEVREKWQLGRDPIPNMTELLELHGIKVLLLPLPESVHGLTCLVRRPGHRDVPCIVINRNDTLERRRLTLAHELCHLLADPTSPVDLEKAANRFGGAFLMPANELRQEAGYQRHAVAYEEVVRLKHVYRVAAAAMLVRFEQLGIISEMVMVRIFQTVGRGWRREEPAPLEPAGRRGQMEVPERFERLCYRALAEKLVSLPKAAELLQRPAGDIKSGAKGPTL
jgi:Zn-dependent peptidase ImmA (M78 family)/DNA-binding XRE family transcriptional regulator